MIIYPSISHLLRILTPFPHIFVKHNILNIVSSEPEGRCCYRHCTAIAPFWFSTDDMQLVKHSKPLSLNKPYPTGLIQRLRSRERERERQRRSELRTGSGRMAQSLDRDRNTLSYDARPFYPRDSTNSEDRSGDYEPLPPSKQALGERLFPRVYALQPVSSIQQHTLSVKRNLSLLQSVTH